MVKLLGFPDVIFKKDLIRNQLIIVNKVEYDDPLEEVIEATIERITVNELTKHYKIEPFSSKVDFLEKICHSQRKLGKSCVPACSMLKS